MNDSTSFGKGYLSNEYLEGTWGQKARIIVGYILAAPWMIIVLGLWILPLYRLKQISFTRFEFPYWEWEAVPDSKYDKYLNNRWAGLNIGIFNVYNDEYANSPWTVKHERRHGYQFLVLNIFMPILYFGQAVVIWLLFWDRHSYIDLWFELDARTAAGQELHPDPELWFGKDDRWAFW